ncbi:hypothetical protein [Synechococcus sp. Cu2B8-bc1011]|uniref:hypothetical protein n=1 Tax=Synechococcus sp. Cu2B8-bc1011 TaxID=3093725 RepID=UPI0039B0ADA8
MISHPKLLLQKTNTNFSKIMNNFKLLSLCSLLVFATPLASFAQLKNTTFSSGSKTEAMKFSKGQETITSNIKKTSLSDGDSSIQTISITMSGQNVEGLTNEVMLQSFEQMESQGNAAMEQLRLGVAEDSNLGGELNSIFTSTDNADGFTMTTTMSTNEQDAIMSTSSEEDTTIIRVDNYEVEAFTDSFLMENGTISSFDS